MIDITSLNTWQDVNDSDIMPSQIPDWEMYKDITSIIDENVQNIIDQLNNYNNLGINYLYKIESYENSGEEIKNYIYDQYKYLLEQFYNIFSIPNYDDAIDLPTETKKVLKLLYTYFVADYLDDLAYYLMSNDFDKLYKSSSFTLCKKLVIDYYKDVIKSLEKILNFISSKTQKEQIAKKIDELGYIINVVKSTDPRIISEYFIGVIENMF